MIDYIELPEGWTSEPCSNEHTLITSPSRYMVTIDFKSRCFRAGMSTHGRKTSSFEYTGRGWKTSLCHDAVKFLVDLENSP